MDDETQALVSLGLKAAAARVVASLQPPAADDGLADLAQAQATFAARGPQAAREDARFACNALRLFRACTRGRCRKAQACRGDPVDCYARASVPEPARKWAARLLLAERMPGLRLLSDARANRLAYECWIAGIEARR